MSIKTIRKACLLSMFIIFGILPSLSWGGGEIYSNSKGNIGSVDENGTVYSHSKGFIGHVDPGDIMGALYLLKDEF